MACFTPPQNVKNDKNSLNTPQIRQKKRTAVRCRTKNNDQIHPFARYFQKNKNKNFIKELITNSDGRTDQNLLNDKEFFLGKFELNFHVGDYIKLNSNNFSNLQGQLYEIIPVNFNIFSNRNYHIPLLLSPFGYSTYLGS